MDEREKDQQQVDDLDVPEREAEDLKGGNTWAGKWYVPPGAANEGAEPHLRPGGNQGFQGGV